MQPPARTAYSFKRGSDGIGVWALQRALNELSLWRGLVEDGSFGPATEATVRSLQDLERITADGIAGPQTQDRLARRLVRAHTADLPGGLMTSIIDGESGSLIAAVNWSVAGGVDCGYTQRRVYGPPFADAEVERAFDSGYQMGLLRRRLLERFEVYRRKVPTELAWRLATLYHNYPSAADKIAAVGIAGLSPYWTSTQKWVTDVGAEFPDGAPVRTPLEWCEHYSLGSTEHGDPGRMVRFVTDWTP